MKVFISYRLKQVNSVRPVVDTIRAAGITVWFNEYDILFNNIRDFEEEIIGEDHVKANLVREVASCTHAILFTNNEWSDSGYCSAEATAILAGIEPGNIIQVHTPKEEKPHVKFPILRGVKQVLYNCDPYSVASEIIEYYSKAPPSHDHYPESTSLRFPQVGLSIEPGIFKIERNKTKALRDPSHILFSGSYCGTDIRLGIHAYPYQPTIDGLSHTIAELTDSGQSVKDYDLQLRNSYLKHVGKWAEEEDLVVEGLHIFFFNDRSHVAVTYETPTTIERRFILSQKGNPMQVGELHFIFYIMKDQFESPASAQIAFSKCTPLFDAFIGRIHHAVKLDISQTLPSGFTRTIYALAALITILRIDNLSGIFLCIPILAGVIIADFMLFITSDSYRQLLAAFGIRGALALEHETPEEVWSEIWANMLRYLPSCIYYFLLDTWYGMLGTRFGFAIPVIAPITLALWAVLTNPSMPRNTTIGILLATGAISQGWLVRRLLKRARH